MGVVDTTCLIMGPGSLNQHLVIIITIWISSTEMCFLRKDVIITPPMESFLDFISPPSCDSDFVLHFHLQTLTILPLPLILTPLDWNYTKNLAWSINPLYMYFLEPQNGTETYRINMEEKVMIWVIKSFEQSPDLSKCSAMECDNKCNPDWISIWCIGNINPLCRTPFFPWNWTSPFNIKIIKFLCFR